ncbi:hypothetical protein BN844_4362 [Pseudomonas sp. SHC52]|nr:hypothetical protein BN844_4362 [Pseudomonas sp. SHC52]
MAGREDNDFKRHDGYQSWVVNDYDRMMRVAKRKKGSRGYPF